MDKVTSIASQQHEMGVRISILHLFEGFLDSIEGEVDGEGAHYFAILLADGLAVSGNGLVMINQTFSMSMEGINPAGLTRINRRLIPYFIEIIEVGFDDSGDGIVLINRIY